MNSSKSVLKRSTRKSKVKLLTLLSFLFVAVLIGGYYQKPVRFKIAGHYFGQGQENFSSKNYDLGKAEAAYRRAVFFDPEFSNAHYQLSRVYFVQNQLDAAKVEIDKALEFAPGNKRAYYIRGLIDGHAKRYDEAISDFEKFVEWAPAEWAGHNDLAWAYYQNGNYEKAKETAEIGLKIAPDNVWLLNGLGVSLLGLQEFEKAENVLARAKEISENMTIGKWKSAYPGNSPVAAEKNFEKFRDDVDFNGKLAMAGISDGATFVAACGSSENHYCNGCDCVPIVCSLSDHLHEDEVRCDFAGVSLTEFMACFDDCVDNGLSLNECIQTCRGSAEFDGHELTSGGCEANSCPCARELAVAKAGTGTGTVASEPVGINCGINCGPSPYTANSEIILTAVEDDDSVFSQWSSNCVPQADPKKCKVTMDQTPGNVKTVTATFIIEEECRLTVSVVGRGSVNINPPGVTCDRDAIVTQSYGRDAPVKLTADPFNANWNWKWSGDCNGTNSVCDLTMDGANCNRTATAVFERSSTPTTYTCWKCNRSIYDCESISKDVACESSAGEYDENEGEACEDACVGGGGWREVAP